MSNPTEFGEAITRSPTTTPTKPAARCASQAYLRSSVTSITDQEKLQAIQETMEIFSATYHGPFISDSLKYLAQLERVFEHYGVSVQDADLRLAAARASMSELSRTDFRRVDTSIDWPGFKAGLSIWHRMERRTLTAMPAWDKLERIRQTGSVDGYIAKFEATWKELKKDAGADNDRFKAQIFAKGLVEHIREQVLRPGAEQDAAAAQQTAKRRAAQKVSLWQRLKRSLQMGSLRVAKGQKSVYERRRDTARWFDLAYCKTGPAPSLSPRSSTSSLKLEGLTPLGSPFGGRSKVPGTPPKRVRILEQNNEVFTFDPSFSISAPDLRADRKNRAPRVSDSEYETVALVDDATSKLAPLHSQWHEQESISEEDERDDDDEEKESLLSTQPSGTAL